MLKLTCGLSRKVGEPNFGSRGASVAVEVELDPETFRNPARLKRHIRCGFDRVREAIEEELARPESAGAISGDDVGGRSPPRRRNGSPPDRPATANQLKLLRLLAGRSETDLAALCRERTGREEVQALTLREASRLIDELGGTAADRGRR